MTVLSIRSCLKHKKTSVPLRLCAKKLRAFASKKTMTNLSHIIKKWHQPNFPGLCKQALEALPSGTLPLEKATTQGGMVDDSNISICILNHRQNEDHFTIKFGVFFTEVIGGCNCHDDPLEANAYGEFIATIQASGETRFKII